jgi:hypothetical protein
MAGKINLFPGSAVAYSNLHVEKLLRPSVKRLKANMRKGLRIITFNIKLYTAIETKELSQGLFQVIITT